MGDRVVLAMSGGVDSSAAAVLLHEQGYEVIGLFMRSGESEAICATEPSMLLPVISAASHRQGCCSSEDAADARRVADRLGIPFHSLNFQDSFKRIKEYFADEYYAGRTPNPCVQCNNWLKFGKLWDFAEQVGASFIASGHYAKVQAVHSNAGEYGLFPGDDPEKDQSYVLFGIRKSLLPRVLFPVGGYQKSEIRRLAATAGLRVATKKDSYEICFVPGNDYAAFLKTYRLAGDTSGEFVDTAGNVLGRHSGYEQFTVGQRKGLGIAFGEPRFVIKIDATRHQVVLGTLKELEVDRIKVQQMNWLVDPVGMEYRCQVKVRYRQPAVDCVVRSVGEDCAEVVFDSPLTGVAPGQAAVFYGDERRVLGGGWIA
ncbi:MAG: tRNA 2-thiouridine(34) synthase MnmA [Planctomyces sp.]|nr:tRNA 2-thiouridine(34) synthase MnmA [Planctomyces sp.]